MNKASLLVPSGQVKKLFLSAVLAFATATVFGQGQFTFANSSTTGITNAVTGLPAAGSAADQTDTQVGLYIGNVGDPVNTLTLITKTNCNAPGRFSGGTRTLNGWTGTVQVQVRCWLAITVYPTYEEAAEAAMFGGDLSVVLGMSAPMTFTLGQIGFPPPSLATSGLTPFFLSHPPPEDYPLVFDDLLSALLIGTNAADGTRTIRLSAEVYPGYATTTVKFQYGLNSAYSATNTVSIPPWPSVSHPSVTQTFSPGFTYHWKVVASNSYGTSSSADHTFTVAPTNSGVSGDLNGDGLVSQSELDAVYARYVSSSPWFSLANMAGLGGTNVTFALSNAELRAFSIEYSTNLIDWFPLGPATPRYGFTDTNAISFPMRHYRVRYP